MHVMRRMDITSENQDLARTACMQKCKSKLLALLYPSQDTNRLKEMLRKRLEDKELMEEELKELTHARRTADLVLGYGKKQ